MTHTYSDTALNSKVFDYILAVNKESCGVESVNSLYYLKCDEEFNLSQKIVF